MVTPPPPSIANVVGWYWPGLWSAFVAAANASLSRGDLVTSWWRSPQDNARVQGHPSSQHLVGLAFDATSPDPAGLAAALRARGFYVVEHPRHVHAQVFRVGALAGFIEALGLRRF